LGEAGGGKNGVLGQWEGEKVKDTRLICDNDFDAGFIIKMVKELAKARKKFPYSEGALCALTKEVGELARALLDEKWECIEKEAVQVAVMALRIAIEGDSTLNTLREKRLKFTLGKPRKR